MFFEELKFYFIEHLLFLPIYNQLQSYTVIKTIKSNSYFGVNIVQNVILQDLE